MTTKKKATSAGIKTAARVSLNFQLKNTTLAEYCRENGIDKAQASRALRGVDTTPRAKELKKLLIEASKEPAQVNPQSMTAEAQ
jgi:hypothetical protein